MTKAVTEEPTSTTDVSAARPRLFLPETLVFVLALVTRLVLVAGSAGFRASPGYDQSVYYAATVSFLHGRIPYHDFVLLHPPVVMLAELPAALLGHWTSDQTGFLAANLEFSVIGALNAVLVVIVARRLGVQTRSAVIGGVLYAVWFGSVAAEYSARLEPLGNFFLLLGLLALVTAFDESRPRRRTVLFAAAGALLATAASVKIWFVVPLLVVACWILFAQHRRRETGVFLLGALAAGVVIDVPFLIASRGEMWKMVITAQIDRKSSGKPFFVRLADMTAAYWPRPNHVHASVVVTALLGLVVLALVVGLAWRVRSARLAVVLAAAMIVTLLLTPSWFEQYSDFAAVPVALCAAATAHSLPGRLRLAGLIPAVCAAAVTLAVLAQGKYPATIWWGPKKMMVAARSARCVTSDTPAGLIALDALDRDLHNGCRVWVDAVGQAYLDSHAAGSTLVTNPVWQRKMLAYLTSGEMAYPYMGRRPLDAHTQSVIARGGLVAHYRTAKGRVFRLYRISPTR